MAGLLEATIVRASANGLTASLDPAWNIWGPAGGYIAAIAMSAVRGKADASHRPVSMTGQFVRVAKPGELDVSIATIKTGGSALFAVTLAQGGQPVFLAQVWTTSRNDASLPLAPVMPEVASLHSLRGQDELIAERGVEQIAFWRNLEGRPANFRLTDDPPPAIPTNSVGCATATGGRPTTLF